MTTDAAAAPRSERESRWRLAGEWFGILGGPGAWALQLTLGNGFAEVGCEAGGFHGISTVLLAITAGAALITIAAGVVAWTDLRRLGRPDGRVDGRETTSHERAHFMAVSGLFTSGLFLALILMGGALPHLVLATCTGI